MKYVKKQIPVEAFQWDAGRTPNPSWVTKLADDGKLLFKRRGDRLIGYIHTESGVAQFNEGDYIVTADGKDVYPVKREVFESTYVPYDLILNQEKMAKDKIGQRKTKKKVVKNG
jgi:hypothetical protein